MILDKEDWQEPSCCLKPQTEGRAAAGEDTDRTIMEIIREFDRILARDAGREAGKFLEDWLERFEKSENWPAQITILNEMMGFYRNTGDREKGLESVRKGLELAGTYKIGETVSGGTTYLNAATTMKAFGMAREAMPYYQQALRSYNNGLDPEDYRFGSLFNNMALAYEDLEEYEKAEDSYHRAMKIMEKLKPGSILELAVTWVNLACLYEKWGCTGETDGCLLKAADYFHSPEVPHDAYYAFNCRKCAKTFDHFGYFRMKKELTEEADRIYREGGKQ